MTRSEHVVWCKTRAREYLDMGDPVNAVASMLSDLTKHPDTEKLAANIGPLGLFASRSVEEARRFVEGFVE